jgi:hypothetical protein
MVMPFRTKTNSLMIPGLINAGLSSILPQGRLYEVAGYWNVKHMGVKAREFGWV